MTRVLLLLFFLVSFTDDAQATSFQACFRDGIDNVMKIFPVVFKGTAVITEAAEETLSQEQLKTKKERWGETWEGLAGTPQATTFRLVESYKGSIGALGDEIKLFHRSAKGLGFQFAKAEIYVVFAMQDEGGRLILPLECKTVFKAGDIPTEGSIFTQLKLYSHEAAYLDMLNREFPENMYFYLERAAFYERYDEFARAAEVYKKGLEKRTGRGFEDAVKSSGVDHHASRLINGYNRVRSLKPTPPWWYP